MTSYGSLIVMIILIFRLSTIYAKDNFTLVELIKKNLPEKLEKVFFEAKETKDIEKILGKPDLSEKQTYYYIIDGFKYSLSIAFHQNKIAKIRFHLPKDGTPYGKFTPFLPHIPKLMEEMGTHKEGRYFSQYDPKKGIKLVFKNNSKKTLFSVTKIIGAEP